MENSVGFIGGGRITRILLQGFKNRNVKFGKIIVADANPDALTQLKHQFPNVQSSDVKIAAGQDLVFISLHPPVIMDTLESIKGDVRADSIVLSLAPKINLARLSSKLAQVKNIARLIPNATSYINEGYNPVTFSPGFDPEQKQSMLDLLSLLGNTFEVSEDKLESYAIMSAMLPTYFWFQWHELAGIGKNMGLSEEESRKSINETLVASLDLMYKSNLTPAEVIDLIPVKPIGEHEPQIIEIYKTKLLALFEKLRP